MTQQPMDLSVTDLPEYGELMRTYQLARGEAERDGDQLKLAQADSVLNRGIADLKDRKFAAIQAGQRLDAARTATAAKFPKVKPELYAHIQDPAAIEAYAATLQASIDEASGTPPRQPEAPPAAGGSWGGGGSPAGQSPPSNQSPDERLRELMPTVMSKGKLALSENVEARQIASAPILDKLLANASAAAGFNVETGEAL